MAEGGRLPLAGIRVLELGHIVAGPSAALILADLGADVVKVERPDGGDQARQMPGPGASVFDFLNRNKRSIAIDLKKDEGRALFLKLVGSVDVCLDNYAPGALERLGLGYELLARDNPRLLYLSLKGFLPGPYEHRLSLDELAQMMGGLAYMTGPPGQPLRAGASIIDIGAATYGVIGVLAGLYLRELTGEGQKITSGLFETTVFWVGQWMARAVASGEPSRPMAAVGQSVRMGWGVFHLFPTSGEEQVFIAATSNAHWERLCEALACPDLRSDDERVDTNAKRVAARDWLLPRIRQETAKHSAKDLKDLLERHNVPYAPVQRPDELLADPHLNATGQLLDVPMFGKTGRLPKLPFISSAYGFGIRRPPPGLGEHTLEVMKEAGLTPEQIDKLVSAGVVVTGGPRN